MMLPPHSTVTAQWYVRSCLTRSFRKVKELRPRSGLSGVWLHRNNAPAYKAKKTVWFLYKRKLRLTGHPAYSPDLAPLDFFYNPRIKKQLRSRRFANETELVSAVTLAVKSISSTEHRKCFSDWFARMQKCIERGGVYFEKKPARSLQ